MDRQLAQRMVGAACLLAVLVLVVPAILDGNPDSEAVVTRPAVDESLDLRTHTIRLDGEEREPPVPTPLRAAPAQAEAAPADPPPSEPASSEPAPAEIPPKPTAAPPAKPQPESKAEPAREPVRDLRQEPTQPVAAAPARAEGGDWIVQLGSFSQRANADRLAADVSRKGFSVSVHSGGGTSGNLFRVQVGPVADRSAAETLAGRLSAEGFKGGRVGRK